ncbi:MAG: M15 family metallopeptidase [Oscillospiraceae bacterium]
MRIKKTVWTFFMLIMAATLVLIINSRVQLTSEVVVGGADSVFVKTNALTDPMAEYKNSSKASLEKYADLEFPSITITEWQYVLINKDTPIKSYAPSVRQFGSDGPYVDKRMIDSLSSLVDAAKEAGFEPYISVGYRSYADQQQLFNEKASELSQNGVYTYEEAQQIAAEIVAKPGTSDHQTGLAVDILDKEYEVLDYSKMDSKFFDWLDANCAQFGFIKRYPSNKKSVTGWDEPWHYRYVGKEVAEFIMKNGMCLEEFAAHYK